MNTYYVEYSDGDVVKVNDIDEAYDLIDPEQYDFYKAQIVQYDENGKKHIIARRKNSNHW